MMVNTTSPLCRKWMLLFLLVSISSGLCVARSESNGGRGERPQVSHDPKQTKRLRCVRKMRTCPGPLPARAEVSACCTTARAALRSLP